jgi:hypothetical protein
MRQINKVTQKPDGDSNYSWTDWMTQWKKSIKIAVDPNCIRIKQLKIQIGRNYPLSSSMKALFRGHTLYPLSLSMEALFRGHTHSIGDRDTQLKTRPTYRPPSPTREDPCYRLSHNAARRITVYAPKKKRLHRKSNSRLSGFKRSAPTNCATAYLHVCHNMQTLFPYTSRPFVGPSCVPEKGPQI